MSTFDRPSSLALFLLFGVFLFASSVVRSAQSRLCILAACCPRLESLTRAGKRQRRESVTRVNGVQQQRSCAEMLLDSLEHRILGRICAGWVSYRRDYRGGRERTDRKGGPCWGSRVMPGRLGGISRLRAGSGLRSVGRGVQPGRSSSSDEGGVTYVLVDEEDGNVAPLGVFGEGGFDSRDGRF